MLLLSQRSNHEITQSKTVWIFLVCVLFACEPTGRQTVASATPVGNSAAPPRDSHPAQSGASQVWQERIASPSPVPAPSGYEALSKRCTSFEAGLIRAAARVAARQASDDQLLDSDELMFELHAAGVPQVWARQWSLSGRKLNRADVIRRVEPWLASIPGTGRLRCGIAEAHATAKDGSEVQSVAMVAVDAIADLAPVPLEPRVGEWLQIDAELLTPISEAKVFLLGPTGPPNSVPTSVQKGHVKAKVHPDQPGPWLIQVVGVLSSGPRPILEAMIFPGVTPPASFMDGQAPGEEMSEGMSDDAAALTRMINAARESEGARPLARNSELDEIAARHASAMKKARQAAHDLGQGDPPARLAAAGITAESGENVARAKNIRAAHRALWASPSHRGNLIARRWDTLGIGIAKDDDGSVWLCELFVKFGGARN
jgi:hypothetical protein